MNTIDFIEENKIICICRKIYGDDLIKLATALSKGGVRMIEVTFDQADNQCIEKTSEAISLLCDKFGDSMKIGAGTVLNSSQVEAAKNAGAEYIISPNTNESVIKKTKALDMVSIPGAMTPTEIIAAHEMGADFVKLFPTVYLGLRYIKDIKGPISHVKLLGTGGLDEENLADYLKAGMVGAGISSRLVDKKVREAGNYDELTRRASVFMEIAKQFREN